MTVSTAVSAVVTACEGITGIVTVFSGDWDAIAPDSSTPFCTVKGEFGRGTPLTMSATGSMLNEYNITITLYLGSPNIHKEDAHSTMLTMAERFRTAFWGNTTLGGAVFEAFIVDANHNLETFQQEDTTPANMPQVDIILRVREIQQYNA